MRINGFPEESNEHPPECQCHLINCWHEDEECDNIATWKLTFVRKGTRNPDSRVIYVCGPCFNEYKKAECPESAIAMFASYFGPRFKPLPTILKI